MKLLRTIAALSAAATLSLIPVAAHAAVLTNSDAAGDVRSGSTSAATEPATPAPTRALADIVGTRIVHRDGIVRIKVRYRDLARTDFVLYSFQIRTGKLVRNITLVAGPTDYAGVTEMKNRAGKTVSCAVGHKIDYALNTTLLQVPRSCLSNPRFVRVGIGSVSLTSDGKTEYADDARTNGVVLANLVLSPRVYRN